MHMLYNSENFVVVQFDLVSGDDSSGGGQESNVARSPRGGYEIVDKFARKEIFIDGLLAQSFKEGVEALMRGSPSEDELDEYIARFAALMQQPVVLH